MSKENGIVPFKDFIRSEMVVNRFAEVVGERNAAAYVNSVALAVANSPKLQECNPLSIMSAALQAASLRLSCDPQLRQAALVPFKGKAVLVPMYKGLQDMAIRTGKYRYLNTGMLYEGEEIIFDRLSGAARFSGSKQSDEIIGWFASFQLFDGFSKTIYMTVKEIHDHAKQYSASYNWNDSAWKTHPRDMERKTVLRRLLTRWAYLDPNDASMLEAIEDRPFMEVGEQEEYVSGLVLPERADPVEEKTEEELIDELTGGSTPSKKVTREQAQATFDVVLTEERLEMLAGARLGTTSKEKIAGALALSGLLEPIDSDDHYKRWVSWFFQSKKDGMEDAEAANRADSLLADLQEAG